MRGRRRTLEQDWRRILAYAYLEHPDWSAPQYHRQLGVILGKNKAPGLSSVQKAVTSIRTRLRGIRTNPVHGSWHMGALIDFPLPAETLPIILEIAISRTGVNRLTINEAMWAGWLTPIILSLSKKKKPQEMANVVDQWVSRYTWAELMAHATNTEFNTSRLDWTLFQSHGDPTRFRELYHDAPHFKTGPPPPLSTKERKATIEGIEEEMRNSDGDSGELEVLVSGNPPEDIVVVDEKDGAR